MSLPPQVNTDKSGKHRAAAMKESVQHSGEVYYGMGPPALESSHSDSASSSGVYNPEKGPQSLPHYQQAAPVKWMHQDSIQAPGWSQEAPVTTWGQNFGPYMGGVNVRGQMAFHKGVHEGVALPMGGENQLPAPVEVYRDTNQPPAQARGLDWEQHAAAAAMHQAQLQAYQHGHKGVELQGQPHVPSHSVQGSILQPFQATFRPNKQQFSSGYYSVFPGNKPMPNMSYGEQPKTQQQLLHQMQQQQMQQQQQQQQLHQQQQQLHQQHQLQLQQQQQQQHLQQQQQQQQIQQQQMLQQMQQQYHQQQLQERQQQMQQMQQQLQQQNVPQQETTQPQVQPKQQQTQNFGAFQAPEPRPPDTSTKKEDDPSAEPQQELENQTLDGADVTDSCPEKAASEAGDAAPAAPRRSRRLSRDGQSPLGPPSTNIWSQASKELPPSQNGVTGVQTVKGVDSQVSTGGVIQITRRRRRASKEINLETLAQKASEMESLPAKIIKEDGPSGRQASMVPLVIPVSVPVHRSQMDPQGGWAQGRLGQGERPAGQSDRKPSVIVARRRSLRNPMTDSFGQDGESDSGLDEDGKAKFKRRPRPEPLIIPPPRPSTFIPPSVYSSITSYQSNLRSPVRLPDNPLTLPPYTPPPILSPVREGSGLYFSAFLTNIAVSNQILPPPVTPKSAARSLLRSTSSEITPPVLPLITDATPVSLEPRINIGLKYQAEIPDLQDQPSSQFDPHKADLVWLPVDDTKLKHGDLESMEDLMSMACSSVLRGGGTNQELALHCLHECGGDFLETLERLMLQDPIYPKGHHLAGYHYSGSDSWTPEEKRYFNKGISAYRKDFFLVQKLVRTKTVAQCVEYYYTYKKQVKVGRSGILSFGPPDSPMEKHTEAVVDVKSSQHSKLTQGEADGDEKRESSYDHDSSHQARVAQSLQAHDYAGTVLVIKEPDAVSKETHHPSAPHRPRAEAAAKKSRVPTKPPQDPDAIFPCKKCGRVFYKVKSRSAHMKSHAEQEKKAAALRQKEEEEKAAAAARARKAEAAAAAAAHQGGNGNGLMEQADVSGQEDSSEGEDDDDEDWH
ncbi:mitotic deacetylase associated SANT domain protein a isoform X2 [Acanthochromis polyacanthus]|uniref:mitotic deacetylase associated SANT domain protein a isoform X2 n=1 Tax=Acanthochromis polyacanthus TaxID=80966 RepID=UPI002234790A|nr:mitotic deacetylase associated SANT domain protein a isoform X2 [Acanthochromis polyacanthus]